MHQSEDSLNELRDLSESRLSKIKELEKEILPNQTLTEKPINEIKHFNSKTN